MSAITDKASDFWARISPRERRLVVIAAIAVPLTIAIWLGLAIRDGLDAMAARNAKTRKALAALTDLRARGQTHAQVDDVVSTMGTEPLSLDTYSDPARFYSYRRSTHLGEPNYGRQFSLIGLPFQR